MRKIYETAVATVSVIILYSLLYEKTVKAYDGNKRICGQGNTPICCPGWHNGIGAPCSIASCAGNCGDRGRCIKPNTCLCHDGHLRFSCETFEERMQSDQAINSCPDDCNRQGKCVSGKCVCESGYTGKRCEQTVESSCFTALERGLCVSALHQKTAFGNVTTRLTREKCCNALGVAWGEPCEPCRVTYCGKGYFRQNDVCRDINECQIDGICRGGQCINMEGTYSCKCPAGHNFEKDTLECVVSKNACHEYGHQCLPGGRCIDLRNGDFKCLCNWQYMASSDQKSCMPRKKLTFDICSLYKQSVCKNGACISRDNSYECSCNEGFQPSADRKTCQHKIDVCTVHRGYLCKNGDCVSLGRDFYCKCNPGYILSFDRRRCINQCEQLGSSACRNGQCIAQSFGGYECQCFPGYHTTADRKYCIPSKAQSYRMVPGSTEPYSHSILFRRPQVREQKNFGYSEYQQDTEQDTPEVVEDRSWNYSPSLNPPVVYDNRPPCSQPQIVARCAGGFCFNLGGSAYQCECLPGYKWDNRGRYCNK